MQQLMKRKRQLTADEQKTLDSYFKLLTRIGQLKAEVEKKINHPQMTCAHDGVPPGKSCPHCFITIV